MSRRSGWRRAAAAVFVLALALGAPPLAAEPAKPAADPVVAEINGEKILRSELVAIYRGLPQQLRQRVSFEQLYVRLLDHVVSIRLLTAEGRKLKLEDSADVKRKLREAEGKLVYEAYVAKVVAEKVTEAKIKEAYDAFAKQYKGEEEVRASHILVKTEQEAKDIIAQLEKGEDFEKIARAKSTDPSKDRNGGDLGFFTRKKMIKEFAEAAFALKKGEISKAPVKTQFGWHVIKVTDRRSSAAPKFDTVKDAIRQKLAEGVAADEIERLKSAAKITRYDAEGKPLKEEEKK